jgi:ankyrin repeat protein
MLGLLLAGAIALPAAHAQQQNPSAEPALPDRIREDIRSFFRQLFGGGDAPAPQGQPEPQSSPKPPAANPNPPAQAARPAPAASQPLPVAASPSAAAAPLSLHSAIAKGDYASALKMIDQGTDIEAKDPGAGASPLHYAVMKGALPMIGMLVLRGADVNSRTRSGTAPLHTAVLYNHYEAAEYLIAKGADVNLKSTSGVTPLELALTAKYKHIEKLLRDHGAR